MIVCIEGPDRCGKSTLFEAMRKSIPYARFVEAMPVEPCLAEHMDALERRQMHMWEQLCTRDVLYVCTRIFAVSGVVYSKLYRRGGLAVPVAWRQQLRVLHLLVPTHVLVQRHAGTDPFPMHLYTEVKRLYLETVDLYEHCILDGRLSVDELAEKAKQEVERWILESTGGGPGAARTSATI